MCRCFTLRDDLMPSETFDHMSGGESSAIETDFHAYQRKFSLLNKWKGNNDRNSPRGHWELIISFIESSCHRNLSDSSMQTWKIVYWKRISYRIWITWIFIYISSPEPTVKVNASVQKKFLSCCSPYTVYLSNNRSFLPLLLFPTESVNMIECH